MIILPLKVISDNELLKLTIASLRILIVMKWESKSESESESDRRGLTIVD